MGATVFGGTDTERIQITEKTLYNTGGGKYARANIWIADHGSMTNFAEIYLDVKTLLSSCGNSDFASKGAFR